MNKRLFLRAGGLGIVSAALTGCASNPMPGLLGGWTTLLDGSNMDEWNAIGNANWHIADGTVMAGQGTGFLVSKKSYADFELRVEFWADETANSGIFMRCADPKVVTDKNSYEANIFDRRPDPTYGTGAIVGFAKIANMPKAANKWNTYAITAKGEHIVVTLNGAKTVELRDKSFASGPIALQRAAGTIKFRKVQIRTL